MPNHAVTCPESELALKVKVLKKAADLAAKEKTTVRIPIATQGEVKNFGVYAVPGLETHVFVGPFTSKNEEISDNDDIVCLDDDNQNKEKAVNLPDTNRQPMVNFFIFYFFSKKTKRFLVHTNQDLICTTIFSLYIVHCVAKVYTVLPVSTLKCPCSGGRE